MKEMESIEVQYLRSLHSKHHKIISREQEEVEIVAKL